MSNIVKTEIKLDAESVREIVVAETAKAMMEAPGMMETMVKEILFSRPPKRNSYDKDLPTFYESVVQKTMRPMVEEEVQRTAEQNRGKLKAIIKKAFKSGIIDNDDFEARLIAQLSKFSSNISFYVESE